MASAASVSAVPCFRVPRTVCNVPRIPHGEPVVVCDRKLPQARALFYTEESVPVDPRHPELATLRANADWKQISSMVAFVTQLGLVAAAGAVLSYALSLTPSLGLTAARGLVGAGAVLSVLTSAFAWSFFDAAKQMSDGKVVTPSWISGNLLRCMVLNLAGGAAAVAGVQAALGTLASGPVLAKAATAVAQQALDVFAVQAGVLVVLAHLASMAYLNTMFRMVRKTRYTRNGVALGSWDGGN